MVIIKIKLILKHEGYRFNYSYCRISALRWMVCVGQHVKIALVGRPNVGKSALFNRLCGERISIVDEQEGVTRDRLYAEVDFFGRPFVLVDTGGIDSGSKLPFQEEVCRQALLAVDEADALVLVVDGGVGLSLLDEEVARLLLRKKKPVVLAVNKIDCMQQLDRLYPFYSLGIGRMVGVSALHGFHSAELLEEVFQALGETPSAYENKEERSPVEGIRVAVVGRPNVGKSTLVNAILQQERCIVSPIAGTTRDSIDAEVEVEGTLFTLIDTAGIRRKRSEREAVDKFAAIRTEKAIERADICILMLEAQEGISVQEKKIAKQIEEAGKGCILLFNKWDLVKGVRMEHCQMAHLRDNAFLQHCPSLFASALTGRNVGKLFGLIKAVDNECKRRVGTGQLNKFMEAALQKYHPPMLQGRRLRIYYLSQIEVAPPHFVLFVNTPELMVDSYKKYLIHEFRKTYGFQGVPLRFSLRGKNRERNQKSLPN